MAFLMTPPTRATLPVAEMSSVRTHAAGHAAARTAASWSSSSACTRSPRRPRWPRPRIVGLLVDTVTQQGDVATVDRLAVGLAVAVVAQTVLTWFARRSSFRMGEDLFAELREQFMDRVVSLPLSTVERAGTGDLVSRTTNDVEAFSHVARFGIPSIFVAVVTVAITCVAAFLTGWMVALAIVVGFPLLWLSTRWYLRYAPAGYLRERATYAVMNGVVTESVDGARTVDALRLGRRRRARIDHAISDAYDAEMYTLRLRMWWFPQVEIAYLLPVAVTLLWGGWLVAQRPDDRGHRHRGRALRPGAGHAAGRAARCGSTRSRWAPPRSPGSSGSPTCRRTGRPAGRRRATAGSRSRTSGMRTGPVATCSTASPSTSCPGSGWPSSVRPGRASRRSGG